MVSYSVFSQNLQVLQKLIKSRGKSQVRSMKAQLETAEKLTKCPPMFYDLVVAENRLQDACADLISFLEKYWRATHPQFG